MDINDFFSSFFHFCSDRAWPSLLTKPYGCSVKLSGHGLGPDIFHSINGKVSQSLTSKQSQIDLSCWLKCIGGETYQRCRLNIGVPDIQKTELSDVMMHLLSLYSPYMPLFSFEILMDIVPWSTIRQTMRRTRPNLSL